MKRLFSFLAVSALLMSPALAQDDMYFVPKKKKTTQTTITIPSTQERNSPYTDESLDGENWYMTRGGHMDVDTYNRRYTEADTTYMEDTYSEEDTYYVMEEPSPTARLVRFHGYYDPWYYSSLAWDNYYGMPYDWYYDPWYYGSWGRHGWSYTYGLGWYSWHHPHYYSWGWNHWNNYYYGWGWHHPYYGGGHHHNHWTYHKPSPQRPQSSGYRGGRRQTVNLGTSTASTNRGYAGGSRSNRTISTSGTTGSRLGLSGVQNPGVRSSYQGNVRTSRTQTTPTVKPSTSGTQHRTTPSITTVPHNTTSPRVTESRSSSSSTRSSSSFSGSSSSRSSGSSFGGGSSSRGGGGSFGGGGGSRGGRR